LVFTIVGGQFLDFVKNLWFQVLRISQNQRISYFSFLKKFGILELHIAVLVFFGLRFEVFFEKLQRTNIVAPEQIRHKLNYFSFCRIFERLHNICAEILIKLPLSAKIFRIKKPSAQVKIYNLINYLPFCCGNHSGTMVTNASCERTSKEPAVPVMLFDLELF